MATHSSVLAWRIPGMGESGGLLSMGLHRVGHDWSDLAAAVSGVWVQGACTVLCFCSQHSVAAPNILLLLPALRKCQVDFFGLFVSFIQNLHQLYKHAAIFSPLWFLVFCCFLESFIHFPALLKTSNYTWIPLSKALSTGNCRNPNWQKH